MDKGTSWTASMDNRTLFEAPFPDDFYAAAKELLRSMHSASLGPHAVRAFLRRPGRRTGRSVAGAAFHAVRLPLIRRRMVRRAVSDPNAVESE